MKQLKSHIYHRFNELYLLCVSMTFSIVLLILRMKIHQEFFFLFLVWNLFLAIIPYSITFYLSSKKKHNKFCLFPAFLIWLLFLPNAPYIITDLLHLKITNGQLLWLDVILIASFAINGMTLFLISLSDMTQILNAYINKRWMIYFTPSIIGLTGFGIYLGRFLRYNSWEVIQNPITLYSDIIYIISHPLRNMEAWVFTISFSLFLYVIYLMFIAKASLEFDKDRDFI